MKSKTKVAITSDQRNQMVRCALGPQRSVTASKELEDGRGVVLKVSLAQGSRPAFGSLLPGGTPLPLDRETLLGFFLAGRGVVDMVTEPRLVHWDLHEGNLFVDAPGESAAACREAGLGGA